MPLVLVLPLAATPAVSATPAVAPPPAAPVPVPFPLAGAHPLVRWRNVDDAHVVRVVVRRLAGATAPATPADGDEVFDGPPSPDGSLQVVPDTVAVGATYTYGLWSYDAAGEVSAQAQHSIEATAPPLLVAPAVASTTGTGAALSLRWGNPANAVGTPYTVKVQTRDRTGTLSAPAIWLLDTTATSATFPGRAGATYRFEVLSQDPYGNDTVHATATVLEPYDTRSAVLFGGWRTLRSTRRWGSTVAVGSAAGASVTWHVRGSQVAVVADRCPGCGKALLLVDGKVRAVIDTHAAALSVRQVLGTVAHLAQGRHTVTVRVVGTSGHPGVHVDALAVLD